MGKHSFYNNNNKKKPSWHSLNIHCCGQILRQKNCIQPPRVRNIKKVLGKTTLPFQSTKIFDSLFDSLFKKMHIEFYHKLSNIGIFYYMYGGTQRTNYQVEVFCYKVLRQVNNYPLRLCKIDLLYKSEIYSDVIINKKSCLRVEIYFLSEISWDP